MAHLGHAVCEIPEPPILHPHEVDAMAAQFHAWGMYSMRQLSGSDIRVADWARAQKDRYLGHPRIRTNG